jgi:hypothetical protein
MMRARWVRPCVTERCTPTAEFSPPGPRLVEQNGHMGCTRDSWRRLESASLSGVPKKGFAALSAKLAG